MCIRDSVNTDTLSGDVRLYGTSLDSLSDGTDAGIKIANDGISAVHVKDSQITNAKLQNSTLTINGNAVSLGSSVTVPVHEHKDTATFDFTVGTTQVNGIDTDTLSGDVRLYGTSLDSFCLLYTSPSPRDRTRSRMPSSA